MSSPKSNCNTCKREQLQSVLASYDKSGRDPDNDIWGKTEWQVVQCGGCGTISFREIVCCSEDRDPETGEYIPTVECFPPSQLELRDFPNVPDKIREVYREVVETFSRQAYVLCAAGLRAVIEGICSDQKIRTGPVKVKTKTGAKMVRKKDLRGKIEGLLEKGLITKSHRDTLHQHRYSGNEAVHELEPPESAELSVAIKIVEHTLEHIYELPKSAATMVALSKKRKQAKRKPRKAKTALPPPPSVFAALSPPVSASP